MELASGVRELGASGCGRNLPYSTPSKSGRYEGTSEGGAIAYLGS
jgi:hypothetical protein